jgi:hypothetical protein
MQNIYVPISQIENLMNFDKSNLEVNILKLIRFNPNYK